MVPRARNSDPRINGTQAVRECLERNSSLANTALFQDLLGGNSRTTNNGPLKCSAKFMKPFGSRDADLPQQSMHASAFRFENKEVIATPEQVCDILVRELETAISTQYDGMIYWPQSAEVEEAVQAADLIRNLVNPEFKADGMVLELPSPVLEQLATTEKWPNTVSRKPMTSCVLPHGMLIPLQHHNETTSFSTLLVGEIIWIIWPPTDHNLKTLQDAYETYAATPHNRHFNVAEKLLGGRACVQAAREMLKLPPYCIVLGLVTKTAALASYSILSAEKFIPMLRRIPFLESWWRTEVEGDTKRKQFGNALLGPIQQILDEHYNNNNPGKYSGRLPYYGGNVSALEFLKAWDTVSNGVVALMDVGKATMLSRVMKDALFAAKKDDKCAMCGKRARGKMEVERHFDKFHWPVPE